MSAFSSQTEDKWAVLYSILMQLLFCCVTWENNNNNNIKQGWYFEKQSLETVEQKLHFWSVRNKKVKELGMKLILCAIGINILQATGSQDTRLQLL